MMANRNKQKDGPVLGRRTGVDVRAGKQIRVLAGGFENFDDYWSESEQEESISTCLREANIPNISVNLRKKPLKSMSPFTPTEHDESKEILVHNTSRRKSQPRKRPKQNETVVIVQADGNDAPEQGDDNNDSSRENHCDTDSLTTVTSASTSQRSPVKELEASNAQCQETKKNDKPSVLEDSTMLSHCGNIIGTISRGVPPPLPSEKPQENSYMEEFKTRKRLTYSGDVEAPPLSSQENLTDDNTGALNAKSFKVPKTPARKSTGTVKNVNLTVTGDQIAPENPENVQPVPQLRRSARKQKQSVEVSQETMTNNKKSKNQCQKNNINDCNDNTLLQPKRSCGQKKKVEEKLTTSTSKVNDPVLSTDQSPSEQHPDSISSDVQTCNLASEISKLPGSTNDSNKTLTPDDTNQNACDDSGISPSVTEFTEKIAEATNTQAAAEHPPHSVAADSPDANEIGSAPIDRDTDNRKSPIREQSVLIQEPQVCSPMHHPKTTSPEIAHNSVSSHVATSDATPANDNDSPVVRETSVLEDPKDCSPANDLTVTPEDENCELNVEGELSPKETTESPDVHSPGTSNSVLQHSAELSKKNGSKSPKKTSGDKLRSKSISGVAVATLPPTLDFNFGDIEEADNKASAQLEQPDVIQRKRRHSSSGTCKSTRSRKQVNSGSPVSERPKRNQKPSVTNTIKNPKQKVASGRSGSLQESEVYSEDRLQRKRKQTASGTNKSTSQRISDSSPRSEVFDPPQPKRQQSPSKTSKFRSPKEQVPSESAAKPKRNKAQRAKSKKATSKRGKQSKAKTTDDHLTSEEPEVPEKSPAELASGTGPVYFVPDVNVSLDQQSTSPARRTAKGRNRSRKPSGRASSVPAYSQIDVSNVQPAGHPPNKSFDSQQIVQVTPKKGKLRQRRPTGRKSTVPENLDIDFPDDVSLGGQMVMDNSHNEEGLATPNVSVILPLDGQLKKREYLDVYSLEESPTPTKRVTVTPVVRRFSLAHQGSSNVPRSGARRSILKHVSRTQLTPGISLEGPIHYYDVTESQTPLTQRPSKRQVKIALPNPEIAEGVRRSKRTRVKALDWFRGERIQYDRRKSGLVVAGIISPEENTEKNAVKMRKRKLKRLAGNNKRKEKSKIPPTPRNLSIHENFGQDFDDTLTSEVPVINPITGEEALINCVVKKDQFRFMNTAGKPAAQDDPIQLCKSLKQIAFSVGQLIILGGEEKGTQLVRKDSMVFIVKQGKVAVTIHRTTSIMETDDTFFVPCGNTYNIKNLRRDPAKLWFFQHKGS